jgi:hypothetical protein
MKPLTSPEPQIIFHPSEDNVNQQSITIELYEDTKNIVVQPTNATYDYISEIRNSQKKATVVIHDSNTN